MLLSATTVNGTCLLKRQKTEMCNTNLTEAHTETCVVCICMYSTQAVCMSYLSVVLLLVKVILSVIETGMEDEKLSKQGTSCTSPVTWACSGNLTPRWTPLLYLSGTVAMMSAPLDTEWSQESYLERATCIYTRMWLAFMWGLPDVFHRYQEAGFDCHSQRYWMNCNVIWTQVGVTVCVFMSSSWLELVWRGWCIVWRPERSSQYSAAWSVIEGRHWRRSYENSALQAALTGIYRAQLTWAHHCHTRCGVWGWPVWGWRRDQLHVVECNW